MRNVQWNCETSDGTVINVSILGKRTQNRRKYVNAVEDENDPCPLVFVESKFWGFVDSVRGLHIEVQPDASREVMSMHCSEAKNSGQIVHFALDENGEQYAYARDGEDYHCLNARFLRLVLMEIP